VDDVSKTLTPELNTKQDDSQILLIDLAKGQQRLACSALAQVFNQVGSDTPDVDNAQLLKTAFNTVQQLIKRGLISAYHDRSDGGSIVALLEMAFASRCGLNIEIDSVDLLASLFNEELGMLIQVSADRLSEVESVIADAGLGECVHNIATPIQGNEISVYQNGEMVLQAKRSDLHKVWSSTSYHMQRLRDNPQCADQEYARLDDLQDKGLFSKLSFDVNEDVAAPYINLGVNPKVAILREQGVNGHVEMAAAFSQAQFDAIDVTMTDIISGKVSLDAFKGVVACGGFSYGDVLGAGEGWAKSILYNAAVKDQFEAFFNREDAFTLGICNGCQMVSNLKSIVPGAENWPHFVRNLSEQFEARLVQSQVGETNSVFLSGMAGSMMPVVVAHGEGRAEFSSDSALNAAQDQVALRYVDSQAKQTEIYPANPNGSPTGIAGLSNSDGRITIMMPHPERIFRSLTNSWRDEAWGDYSPWMRMFRNARVWVD